MSMFSCASLVKMHSSDRYLNVIPPMWAPSKMPGIPCRAADCDEKVKLFVLVEGRFLVQVSNDFCSMSFPRNPTALLR
jgi:hypothetical protein